MNHALMRAYQRFKSRRIAFPALQHPDLFLIRVLCGIILPHRTIEDTSPLNFLESSSIATSERPLMRRDPKIHLPAAFATALRKSARASRIL